MAPIKKRSTIRAKIASKSRPAPAPNSLAAASVATSEFSPEENTPSEFASFAASSKKDKRTIKHSAFINKIEKQNAGVGKKRSRRGGAEGVRKAEEAKRLQGRLEGLIDALPDIGGKGDDSENEDDDWEGMSEDETVPAATATVRAGGKEEDMLGALAGMVNVRPSIKKSLGDATDGGADGKMKMKTLKSNRGQAKRKQKLEGKEIERFAKNLAEMNRGAAAPTAVSSSAAPTSGAQGDRWAALRGFIGQTMEKNPNFGKAA